MNRWIGGIVDLTAAAFNAVVGSKPMQDLAESQLEGNISTIHAMETRERVLDDVAVEVPLSALPSAISSTRGVRAPSPSEYSVSSMEDVPLTNIRGNQIIEFNGKYYTVSKKPKLINGIYKSFYRCHVKSSHGPNFPAQSCQGSVGCEHNQEADEIKFRLITPCSICSDPDDALTSRMNIKFRSCVLRFIQLGQESDKAYEAVCSMSELFDPNYVPPPLDTLKSAISKVRQAIYPPKPKEASNISYPDDHPLACTVEEGFRFLLKILPPDGTFQQRGDILIWSTDIQLDCLQRVQRAFFDSTFKTMPQLFKTIQGQFTILHGMQGGKLVPLVFALLPGKQREVYDRFIKALKDIFTETGRTWLLKSIMMDFEEAPRQSFREAFKTLNMNRGIKIEGCFFHYTKALIEKLKELGLKSFYEEERTGFRSFVKCLFALSFLPCHMVQQTFHELKEKYYRIYFSNSTDSQRLLLEQFITYYRNQWLKDSEVHIYLLIIFSYY